MTVNALFVPQPSPHYCTLQHKMCQTRQVSNPSVEESCSAIYF